MFTRCPHLHKHPPKVLFVLLYIALTIILALLLPCSWVCQLLSTPLSLAAVYCLDVYMQQSKDFIQRKPSVLRPAVNLASDLPHATRPTQPGDLLGR